MILSFKLLPLTLKANIDAEVLKSKGRDWQEQIKKNFPEEMRFEAHEIMGLLALAHFRSFSVKEIIQMLNLDPNPDWVFNRVYNDGRQEGRQEGEAALLMRLLQRRFGELPAWVSEKLAKAELPVLEEWSLRLLGAPTLDSVFAERT